jgi:hypothetical protein
MNIKNLLAIITLACFTFSVSSEALHAAWDITVKQKLSLANRYIIPQNCGSITESKLFDSKQIVITIQDLHCHSSLEKHLAMY